MKLTFSEYSVNRHPTLSSFPAQSMSDAGLFNRPCARYFSLNNASQIIQRPYAVFFRWWSSSAIGTISSILSPLPLWEPPRAARAYQCLCFCFRRKRFLRFNCKSDPACEDILVSLPCMFDWFVSVKLRSPFWELLGKCARMEAGMIFRRSGRMTGRQVQTMPRPVSTLIQISRGIIVPAQKSMSDGTEHWFAKKSLHVISLGSNLCMNTTRVIPAAQTLQRRSVSWDRRSGAYYTYNPPKAKVAITPSLFIRLIWRPHSHGIGRTQTTISVKVLIAAREYDWTFASMQWPPGTDLSQKNRTG